MTAVLRSTFWGSSDIAEYESMTGQDSIRNYVVTAGKKGYLRKGSQDGDCFLQRLSLKVIITLK